MQLAGFAYFYFEAYVRREPVLTLGSLVRTVTFIALLVGIGGLSMVPHVLVGVVLAYAFGAGVSQLSVDLNSLTTTRFKYVFVSSPVSPYAYMIGAAIGMSLPALMYVAPLTGILVLITKPSLTGVAVFLSMTLSSWATGLAIGFIVASRERIALRMLYLTDILYSLLVYVMPVYCPIEVLPEKLKYLAYASPLTHIVLISIAYTGLSELQPST